MSQTKEWLFKYFIKKYEWYAGHLRIKCYFLVRYEYAQETGNIKYLKLNHKALFKLQADILESVLVPLVGACAQQVVHRGKLASLWRYYLTSTRIDPPHCNLNSVTDCNLQSRGQS